MNKKYTLMSIVLVLLMIFTTVSAENFPMYEDLYYTILPDNTIEITGFSGSFFSTTADIPDSIDGHPVSSIGSYAFCGTNISKITIPSTVNHIGDYAFQGTRLTSISIPDSITSIGVNPFAYCSYLNDINVSGNHPVLAVLDWVLYSKPDKRLVFYESWRFQNQIQHSFVVPQGIKIIDAYAFAGFPGEEIVISDTVSDIREYAFIDTNLTSVFIPKSVSFIDNNPWLGCRIIDSFAIDSDNHLFELDDRVLYSNADKRIIYFPVANTWWVNYRPPETYMIRTDTNIIGDNAFSYSDIQEVIIPNSVHTIGNQAFKECHKLKEISIPDSVSSIGAGAFYECSHLSHIELSNSLQVIPDNAFTGCRFTEVTIPDSVAYIGNEAFYCVPLRTVSIPCNVMFIGEKAFRNTDLSEVELQEGLQIIKDEAFSSNGSLMTITLPTSITYIAPNAFDECRQVNFSVSEGSYADIYCQENNLQYRYSNAWGWLND